MNSQNTFRLLLAALMLLPIIASAMTIDIGASYDEVIQKLGEPDGEINLGDKQILTYGDAKVTLSDKAVVKISPEFESLLAERAEKLKEIQAKRDANLINFRGQWITLERQKQIIRAESKKRAENNTTASNEVTWMTDFKKASELAKLENKKLLLNFTGSDWCGWCMKLENEVFSKAEFKQYAQKHYVLVKLDFPKKKKLPPALERQNRVLAKNYSVTGFPSVIVLKPSGKFHARGGYVKGGPNAFLRSIL